jgi:hypothetical protein
MISYKDSYPDIINLSYLDSYQHYACYMNIKIKSREVIELIFI